MKARGSDFFDSIRRIVNYLLRLIYINRMTLRVLHKKVGFSESIIERVILLVGMQGSMSVLMDSLKGNGFNVVCAGSPDEAGGIIDGKSPDLVISELNGVPSGDNLTSFEKLQKKFPYAEQVIITGSNVDQFIPLMRRYNIGNVLLAGSEKEREETGSYLRSILIDDMCGLGYHFSEEKLKVMSIQSYAQAKEACNSITGVCPGKKGIFLDIALDELISNAFFHATLRLSGLPRECWLKYSEVKPDCPIRLTWAYDEEKVGVSVIDFQGNLRKADVLKWLDTFREGFAVEEHGRGFLLVRRLIDRMIIDIKPGKRTECIAIQYFSRQSSDNKPLMIHES